MVAEQRSRPHRAQAQQAAVVEASHHVDAALEHHKEALVRPALLDQQLAWLERALGSARRQQHPVGRRQQKLLHVLAHFVGGRAILFAVLVELLFDQLAPRHAARQVKVERALHFALKRRLRNPAVLFDAQLQHRALLLLLVQRLAAHAALVLQIGVPKAVKARAVARQRRNAQQHVVKEQQFALLRDLSGRAIERTASFLFGASQNKNSALPTLVDVDSPLLERTTVARFSSVRPGSARRNDRPSIALAKRRFASSMSRSRFR